MHWSTGQACTLSPAHCRCWSRTGRLRSSTWYLQRASSTTPPPWLSCGQCRRAACGEQHRHYIRSCGTQVGSRAAYSASSKWEQRMCCQGTSSGRDRAPGRPAGLLSAITSQHWATGFRPRALGLRVLGLRVTHVLLRRAHGRRARSEPVQGLAQCFISWI